MVPQPAAKPHILQVIPTLGPGGAERLLATYLAQPALKDHFRHTVVMTEVADIDAEIPENFLVRALQAEGVQVIGLGLAGKSRLPQCIRALRRLIRDQGCDLVHTHLLWANIAGRLAGWSSGVPVVSSFHNPDYDLQVIASFQAPAWKQDLIRRLDGFTTRMCVTRSVAVSQYVARHIQAKLGLAVSAIEVIYNPVDTRQVHSAVVGSRDRIFRELGLAATDRLLINVGRVTDQKGILELVEAFSLVSASEPAAHLAIIGSKKSDIDYAGRVERLIQERGLGSKVHLTDSRHDIADWLGAGDMFVFPTKFEGMGIALAEAMGAGLACVATNVGPIPELIRHGESGLLVEAGDIQGLSACMTRLLQDDEMRGRLSRQARSWVAEQLNQQLMSDKLGLLYDAILHNNATSR